MTCSVAIPARLASTRFPGKLLAEINGMCVLERVWRQVNQAQCGKNARIVTDSPEIEQAARRWGASVIMSDPHCSSGTERIASVLDQIPEDFILNVQGDEPFIEPKLLDALAARALETQADLITPVFKIEDASELFNPNIVKVVRAQGGRALYFSRSTIPYIRGKEPEEWLGAHTFWGHVGVYGYRRSVLAHYLELPCSTLESVECLEQLRWLEASYVIQTVETTYRCIEVNTPEDLDKAIEFCNTYEN
jgi:3-deoxy-manno-octulosonate cytidylyltransferase (CMP-KDO synthetase)